MRTHGIQHFILSSTAAIFGEPKYTPIDERHPKHPINPYGRTKLMIEQVLADYDKAYGMKSACLRYFNAAGADPDGWLGERHDPETHLIPLVLQVASGRRSHISLFGRDYDTPDGTCIRDYIHIQDLCSAHWLALQSLMRGADSQAYNLGNGNGFSVQEVIDTAERVTGRKIPLIDLPRREGDPACLVADPTLSQKQLGWMPQYGDLPTIIEHAWKWELRQGL
jgi:UDP-glucose 4-epimerase